MISRLTARPQRSAALALLIGGTLCALAGCERDESAASTPERAAQRASLVSFPAEVQSDDPEVNAFIRKAIEVSVAEDYDAFRLLWSALEQPLGEQEFKKGLAATRSISILDLIKRRTRTNELVYLVHCAVELDPDMPEPSRDIVLLLRKENDQWRVAKPPSKEVQALKAKFAQQRAEANSNGVKTADASTP